MKIKKTIKNAIGNAIVRKIQKFNNIYRVLFINGHPVY